MQKLTQKEIMNNMFKQALERESYRQNKYDQLTQKTGDKRLQEMFEEFARTSQRHTAAMQLEMYNLDIK